jgi:hypothetical protein
VITDTSDGGRSVYAANVHGNSDVDISSASWYDDKITWYENRRGNSPWPRPDTAPATIITDQQDDMPRIVASHLGRTDDAEVEPATFELLFEESAGDPLTTAEANNPMENLHIVRQRR